MKRGKIRPEDVLAVKDGATTGKVSFVGIDFPYGEGAVNEHVFILRGKKDLVKQKFLFYHLYSPIGQRQIDANFHGAAIGGINTQFVKNYDLFLPSLPTQEKIAAVLEKAEKTKKLRAQVDELTDRLLQSVFMEMFGDPVRNPKGWEIKRLDHISEIVSGVTKGRKLSGSSVVSVPYLRVANVQDGFLNLKEIKMIDALPSEVEKFVEKVEAMRQSQNQSKQQIEDLFSVLMQKAFRGEI